MRTACKLDKVKSDHSKKLKDYIFAKKFNVSMNSMNKIINSSLNKIRMISQRKNRRSSSSYGNYNKTVRNAYFKSKKYKAIATVNIALPVFASNIIVNL